MNLYTFLLIIAPFLQLCFCITDASTASNVYSLDDARQRLRFTFDPQRPLTSAQLRLIDNPVERARAGHPNAMFEARRKGRSAGWEHNGQTNGQYVESRLRKQRIDNRKATQRAQQRAMNRVNGEPYRSTSQIRRERRIQEALSGDKDDIMLLHDTRGRLEHDPKGRTKEQYLKEQGSQYAQLVRSNTNTDTTSKGKSSDDSSTSDALDRHAAVHHPTEPATPELCATQIDDDVLQYLNLRETDSDTDMYREKHSPSRHNTLCDIVFDGLPP